MGTPVKVTVIGAGSVQFSLGVVKDLCLTGNLAGSRVTLMDIDEGRLETIHGLAERYVKELGASLTFDRTTDRRRALQDADFVINTAGKEHQPREGRRSLYEKYGRVGGNFHAGYMYNMALMLDIARDVEAICPNAWLIQSGNPVREGTPLITRQTGVKIIGLCHGHYGYINVARVLGLDPEKITWTAPGLNHCIWLTEFRYEGQDAYPILDEWIETRAEAYWKDRAEHKENYGLEDQMSRCVIDQYRKFGLLPIGDTTRGGGWWYKTDIDTRVFWYGPWGGFGSELHRKPWLESLDKRLRAINEVVNDPSRPVLEAFPPVRTREQHVPIIDALTNDVAAKFQINVPNQGALPGVPDHVVTELPVIIDKGGLHRIQLDPLPPKIMLEVIWPHILSIEWGVEAYVTGDAEMLVDALLMLNAFDHGGQAATSYEQARGFVEELLSLPDEQDWAGQFKWRRPSWAQVLERPGRGS